MTIDLNTHSREKKFTAIDLFAGAGGLGIGLKWAGFNIAFASEFDEQIGNSYKTNFPDTPVIIEDIRKVNFSEISEKYEIQPNSIDLIVGGPPCQGFSMANRKRIENDERNLLFLEFVRAVKFFEPKCFLIENVVGMKAENITVESQDLSVIDSINEYFREMGYQISFKTFKSEEHGVPQIRRRVIIVGTCIPNKLYDLRDGRIGNLTKTHYSKEQTSTKSNNLPLFDSLIERIDHLQNPITVQDAISDLPELMPGEGSETCEYTIDPKNDYQRVLRHNSNKLFNHISTPHSAEALYRISLIKQGENFTSLPKELQTKSVHSGAYGRLIADSQTPTITTRFDTPSTGRVIHPFQDRTITVREAARLQSFPDSYYFHGTRTSQGKQVGNAVPPLVGRAIGEMFIKDFLME